MQQPKAVEFRSRREPQIRLSADRGITEDHQEEKGIRRARGEVRHTSCISTASIVRENEKSPRDGRAITDQCQSVAGMV